MAAWRKVIDKLPAQQAEVMRVIQANYRRTQYTEWRNKRQYDRNVAIPGMTAKEVAAAMCVPLHTISGRFSWLRDHKLLIQGARITTFWLELDESTGEYVERSSSAWGHLPMPQDDSVRRAA